MQGVSIPLGADEWKVTAHHEAMYLHKHGVFDNRTPLEIWTEATPRAIFPDRRIGRLKEGYGASFLILSENPLNDFEAVKRIEFGLKQGQIMIEQAADV